MRNAVWLVFAIGVCAGAQTRPFAISRDFLTAHNEVRRRVGVAPLAWSEQLAASAQQWANSLIAGGRFGHRPNNPLGENLFEIRGAAATPAQVVRAWADEARDYDYARNRCRGDACGHYTQIVWRDTKQVGCAVARGRGREVWVCEYSPAGNWEGKRPY